MADQNEGIVGVVGTRADGCEVVCTLPETSVGERIAMIRREILPYARSYTRIADGFQLEFPRDPQIRRNLENWAELEGICCLEARFEISEHAGGLRLTVNGIDPAGKAYEPGSAGWSGRPRFPASGTEASPRDGRVWPRRSRDRGPAPVAMDPSRTPSVDRPHRVGGRALPWGDSFLGGRSPCSSTTEDPGTVPLARDLKSPKF